MLTTLDVLDCTLSLRRLRHSDNYAHDMALLLLKVQGLRNSEGRTSLAAADHMERGTGSGVSLFCIIGQAQRVPFSLLLLVVTLESALIASTTLALVFSSLGVHGHSTTYDSESNRLHHPSDHSASV